MIKTVKPEELREMLKAGEVKFQFKKKSGEIRTAVGTVNASIINDYGASPRGGMCHPKDAGYSIYFDVEKEQFRCYDDNNLIGVVEE